MTNIQELVDNLRSEYQTECVSFQTEVRKDKFNRFSEESKKDNSKIAKIELYEMGEVPRKQIARHAPSAGLRDCF